MTKNQTAQNNAPQEKENDPYKDTVFLPTTAFPMRGNLAQKEPGMIKDWQALDLYKRQREKNKDAPRFLLHDGPPYANGHMHIGHALNKILKDVVIRTKQSRGFDTPYVPGWDCHGLPIEWKIEEKYRNEGKDKDDVDILKFRQECREFAKKWVDIQSEEFQRLGVIGDWGNPYLTMRHDSESKIVAEIHKFLLNGLLYKGVKPVMWSVVEKTALAEAEVEYKEHKSITIWVKFPIKSTKLEALKDANIVIWTTTPWTIPSNRAVAYGEDITYGLYEITEIGENSRAKTGDKIILSQKLAEDVFKQAQITGFKELSSFKGTELAGTVCAHPFAGQGYEFDVPALPAEFVTEDAGTGIVHIAPGHGQDDFYLGQKFGVEMTDNITDDGKFREHVPLFAGLEVYTQKGEMGPGNFAPLKALDEAGNLLAKGSIRHEYPHSWRSKAPLIFRTTPQWFIAMDKAMEDGKTLRQKAAGEISNTTWVPAQGENRIRAMVEGRPDWCISRQRSWGVPIALFLNKKTGEPLRDEAVLNRIVEAFKEKGSDAWWSDDASTFLGPEYDPNDFDKIYDIVDVWFESGATHAFVLNEPDENYPLADLYLEGSDQHRGWFQSSLLESVGTRGKAPFKAVLTHGFTLDDKGYKMSKSMGNVIAPEEITEKYGADILRLWAVTVDYTEDVALGDEIIKNTSDIYRRFRNTLRFLLGALEGFEAHERLKPEEYKNMPELERYILSRLAATSEMLEKDLENHDYGAMIIALHHLCNMELSSLYFDIRKDALYCDQPQDFRRRAARTVMMHIFDHLVTWLAPVLCFTTEEAWSHRPPEIFEDSQSVHLRPFPLIPEEWRDTALETKWTTLLEIRKVVSGALEIERKEKTIGSSLEAAPIVYMSDAHRAALENVDFADICIVSDLRIENGSGDESSFKLPSVEGVAVKFKRADGGKCVRCWKVLPEVAVDETACVCKRCSEAVAWYKSHNKAA